MADEYPPSLADTAWANAVFKEMVIDLIIFMFQVAGAIALAVMPALASSVAYECVSLMAPALEAA